MSALVMRQQMAKVVAELRYRDVEPENCFIKHTTTKLFMFTMNGKETKYIGADLVRECEKLKGVLEPMAENGRPPRFQYTAPPELVEDMLPLLGGSITLPTYTTGVGGAAPAHPAAAAPAAPAPAAAAAAGGEVALQGPATPPAAAAAVGGSSSAAAGRGILGGALARRRGAAVAAAVAAAGGGVSRIDLCGLEAEYPELAYHLQTQSGAGLIWVLRRELRGWARAKHTLKKAQREQKADLDIQRKNLQDMGFQNMSDLVAKLEQRSAAKLAELTAAEAAAKDRVNLVQQHIYADPTARLLMLPTRPAVLWFAVVGLFAMLLGVLLHAVSPQCLEGVKAVLAKITRQCIKCLAGVLWAGWRLGRAVVVALATLLFRLVRGIGMLLLGCCALLWRGCRCIARLLHRWVRRVFMRSASCHQNHQQTPTHPQPHPSQQLQTALCQPAAANAAAIYTATVAMHTSITALRSYYNQQQQQQPTARGAAATGAMGSGVASPPSVCDLCALVVGVSRLVQMEYGALHGQGECHLRDQVLRLLCGLLAVEAGGVIRSEAPLGGGRSDLLIRDREGVSLLVVEYKQRHSGAMSAHQHQDAEQLKKYLSDRRQGCAEGLLITFDKTLPNGLSATRLTRVPDRQAGTQLYRLRNAPGFMSQPLHRLESDPLAVGLMMGLCQGFGIEVVEP